MEEIKAAAWNPNDKEREATIYAGNVVALLGALIKNINSGCNYQSIDLEYKSAVYHFNKLSEVLGLSNQQHGAVWIKTSNPNIKDGEYISKYRKSPSDAWHIGVSVVDATHIHFIEKVSYNIRWQKGHEELHNLFILDESGTAAPEWDSIRLIGRVQDRFKELEEKQHDWRSFYCAWLEGRVDMLQQIKGYGRLSQQRADLIQEANNRDLGGTAAGREEDITAFAEWAGWDWRRVEGKSLWENQKTLEVMKTAQLYEQFKQQKEK